MTEKETFLRLQCTHPQWECEFREQHEQHNCLLYLSECHAPFKGMKDRSNDKVAAIGHIIASGSGLGV